MPSARIRLLLAAACLTGAATLLAGGEARSTEVIRNNVWKSPSRMTVSFPHPAHSALYDCRTCHHKFDAKKQNVWTSADEVRCASCHEADVPVPGQKASGAKPKSLRSAYHAMCIGCHQADPKARQAAAPVMCNQCHDGGDGGDGGEGSENTGRMR